MDQHYNAFQKGEATKCQNGQYKVPIKRGWLLGSSLSYDGVTYIFDKYKDHVHKLHPIIKEQQPEKCMQLVIDAQCVQL